MIFLLAYCSLCDIFVCGQAHKTCEYIWNWQLIHLQKYASFSVLKFTATSMLLECLGESLSAVNGKWSKFWNRLCEFWSLINFYIDSVCCAEMLCQLHERAKLLVYTLMDYILLQVELVHHVTNCCTVWCVYEGRILFLLLLVVEVCFIEGCE